MLIIILPLISAILLLLVFFSRPRIEHVIAGAVNQPYPKLPAKRLGMLSQFYLDGKFLDHNGFCVGYVNGNSMFPCGIKDSSIILYETFLGDDLRYIDENVKENDVLVLNIEGENSYNLKKLKLRCYQRFDTTTQQIITRTYDNGTEERNSMHPVHVLVGRVRYIEEFKKGSNYMMKRYTIPNQKPGTCTS